MAATLCDGRDVAPFSNRRPRSRSPGLRLLNVGPLVAVGEPSIDLVPVVIDDTRTAAMIKRPRAIHAPLGECRTADAEISGGFYGPEPVAIIRGHRCSPWQL